MDNYCIALLVLVLFCLYVDNQNKTEGYSDYGPIKEDHIKLAGDYGPSKDGYGSHSKGAPKPLIQDYKAVGASPQKTTMPAPPSMVPSLHALAPANMNDYMLLHDAVDGYDVMGADLPVAYPRVGAPDNLGRDTLFHDDDDDDGEPMHQPYEADNLHATLDDGGDEDYLTVDQQIRHHETGSILPGGGGGHGGGHGGGRGGRGSGGGDGGGGGRGVFQRVSGFGSKLEGAVRTATVLKFHAPNPKVRRR